MKPPVKHIDDSALTINRVKWGNGFRFKRSDSTFITSKSSLRRLRKLVIPPMWSDVMICGFDDGHIQATGRDLKGRKQYIYHSEWERYRQEQKFKKMISFGRALPEMREACHSLIKDKGWKRNKVLALIILVLDECGIRIGNEQYARENDTYGLTTMRRKHLTVDEEDTLTFSFQGKSGKQREVEIENDELVALIKKSSEMPGYEIFRYATKDGVLESVDSDEVNAFIHEQMGEDFSSKDFRTWVAGRLAVEYYPMALVTKMSAPRKKFSNILIRMVADSLGNTPTVCKDYYVHPAILEKVDRQTLPIVPPDDSGMIHQADLSPAENIVLEVIEDY